MYKSEESGLFEYATAKIMKLMLAKELNKRLKASIKLISAFCHFYLASACMHNMVVQQPPASMLVSENPCKWEFRTSKQPQGKRLLDVGHRKG